MAEKNKTLKQFLYNTASDQCREWIRLDRTGDMLAEYIKGFWIGLGFSILAVELSEEYPESSVEDLAEFMTVELNDRGAKIVGEIRDGADVWEKADI